MMALVKWVRQNGQGGVGLTRDDFPHDFIFGVATAAYQIEGAATADGRIQSHWDVFSHTPGNTYQGDNGDVACDHYHRYPQDVALMASLGVDAYRFSFAWPRVMTEDRKPNPKGLDFYDRLLDALQKAGISPMATLYHWDLPQWLAQRGGWVNRDTVGYFSDYAELMFKHYGDRIHHWITHNEPWCASFLSYALGEHAPGHRSQSEGIKAAHHLLLSHGQTVKGFRGMVSSGQIGITLNLTPVEAASESEVDLKAAVRADGYQNRWFLDPIFRGRYPDDMLPIVDQVLGGQDFMGSDDLATIAQPIDFLGVNYYTRAVVHHDPLGGPWQFSSSVPPQAKVTDMGWEVHPQSLYRLLHRLSMEYPKLPLYITENGAAYPDQVGRAGHINDGQRRDFIEAHLEQALRFCREGGELKGYFLWSLLDNFEWAFGYSKRFGIVYVDFFTQERVMKSSGQWYRQFLS